nr:NADH dehydrogenase subunit 6 [Tegrodera latecincta]
MIIIMFNIIMSLIFITLTHPLSLGVSLLIQTTIISLISGMFCFNYWFSYILFLIMVGGMLILFIYMTSIASNEKFSFKIKSTIPLISLIMSIFISTSMLYWTDMLLMNDMMSFKTNSITISMIKYIHIPTNMMLTFMISYLFIALIAIVKIIDKKSGPLRQKN